MADITVGLNSSILDKMLSQLRYPWRKRIDGGKFMVAAVDGGSDVPMTVLGRGGGWDVDDDAAFLDELIATYLDHRGTPPGSENDAALVALMEPYAARVAAESGRSSGRDTIRASLLADSGHRDRLETFVRAAGFSVTLEWVDVEVSRKPNGNLGNPLALTDLYIAVRAKAEICVRIFGRKLCVRPTTPWFRFEGERAEVRLVATGLRVNARASVRNIDFVVTVLGIRIRIGVTGLVNRFLADEAPVIADLGTVRIAVPGLGIEYAPTLLSILDSQTATTVEIDGAFSG